jgi:ATP phosphoribosyltransferase regulatory subunit HisZ
LQRAAIEAIADQRPAFHQAGIEIPGTDSIRADLEVLLIAYRGLVEVGVAPIVVRVGSVALFISEFLKACGVRCLSFFFETNRHSASLRPSARSG